MGAIALPGWLRLVRPGGDVVLALGVALLLAVLIIPLPVLLLDGALALSITISVLILMVALFLQRPLDFTAFPQILLLSTLLRLALNVATTRIILTHGHEGPQAAGHVVAAFGGFLMGGDVVVGLIVFAILLVVNFMVVTKGSGRIAEVAARFSLDAMPGKQMAIDADLSSGLIDEPTARLRRSELEQESAFHGAMDGAAKFVRGDAIAGLIVTVINLAGGVAIGMLRHGLPVAEAATTFSMLTVGDGLVSQIPALLVSVAAGIVVTKGSGQERSDEVMGRQLGGWKPMALAGGAAGVLGLLPGMPLLPFLALASAAAAAAWTTREAAAKAAQAPAPPPPPPGEPPVAEALRLDLLRLELGYGLLSLAAGEAPRLTEQIRGLRRAMAQEMGFVLPSVRIQDNLELPPDTYILRVKEIEAGRGRLRPPLHLAIDPSGQIPALQGERTTEPTFGLPALWIEEGLRDEALARGCTVVDCAGVLATHLTETVRDHMPELLSFSETQKLLDELPKEHQKLVADIIPSQIGVGGLQRVLQSLLAERVSIRDLPTILEGVQEASAGGQRSIPALIAVVRVRLARQLSEAARGPQGYVPLIALSAEWEMAFAESLTGPPEDRQLAMAPSQLQAFMQRLRDAFDSAANAGETPVLVCSGAIRGHVRAIVERFRPATTVLSQQEIHPRARIRTVGSL
ncbi:flagellar biosynthesis protein FlhA [Siccirubricoccus deserti]|uniref:Flagellar biosynthesis protein FlhA n=1 Tax=Siccirubricoccus deserti TaxID=2013562 RepID=A0A9X0R0M7_9PROT|nr:flagellar biosynthesis protein FlhA [Siccirubricoccus deserti]MBC4017100.1 flagellar biosynthesis protein FlhA [Siccirubricoccus deserti]GGC56764.1 flagellar biosynthesis protein FlhA [Siccirubricoccus deserti]